MCERDPELTCMAHMLLVCFFSLYALQVPDDADKEIEHGKVCEDMWSLDLNKLTVSAGGLRG